MLSLELRFTPRDIQFLPHGQRLLRTGGIMALPLAHMGR